MAYRVDLSSNAAADLDALYIWLAERAPHVYRVFFTIDERAKVVTVLHVRHGARQGPTPGDLRDD